MNSCMIFAFTPYTLRHTLNQQTSVERFADFLLQGYCKGIARVLHELVGVFADFMFYNMFRDFFGCKRLLIQKNVLPLHTKFVEIVE